jgi:hypothetical protein
MAMPKPVTKAAQHTTKHTNRCRIERNTAKPHADEQDNPRPMRVGWCMDRSDKKKAPDSDVECLFFYQIW